MAAVSALTEADTARQPGAACCCMLIRDAKTFIVTQSATFTCPVAGNTTMNAFLPGAGCLERGEGDAAALDAITAAAAKVGCRIGHDCTKLQ